MMAFKHSVYYIFPFQISEHDSGTENKIRPSVIPMNNAYLRSNYPQSIIQETFLQTLVSTEWPLGREKWREREKVKWSRVISFLTRCLFQRRSVFLLKDTLD